jgi:hypothetical protein
VRIAIASLIACSLSVARTAHAQQPLATPTEIDRACNAAEKRAGKHVTDARIFANVAPDEPDAQPMWRSFPSVKALEHAVPDGVPGAQASVWPAADGVVFVEIFFTSDGGDWAQFADLCYRPDGTLARAVDTYNTFLAAGKDDSAGVSRVHTLHFDLAGRIIRRRAKLLDLQTHRPVKRAFGDEKDRIFLRVKDLPFSDLLSASAQ